MKESCNYKCLIISIALIAEGCSDMKNEVSVSLVKNVSSSGKNIKDAVLQLRSHGFSCDDISSQVRMRDFPEGTKLIYRCNFSVVTGLLSARETQATLSSTDGVYIDKSNVIRNEVST